jgi:hypothetical protein
MPHGGKRAGAGRKKGGLASHTLQAPDLRKRLIKAAEHNWDAIIFSLIDNAIAGNTIAQRELLDRVLGEAIQPLGGTDPDGNVLPFQIVISTSNGNNQDRTVSRAV